jgi:glucokinase
MTDNRAGQNIIVGVDLGGTNLRMAVFERGERIAEHKERVGTERDPESLADRIAGYVRDASPAGAPVGIGIAAMLRDHDGVVNLAPNLEWSDVPFGALVRERLPGRTIGVYNDVNAITYGEWACGAGRGVDNLIAVYVGTGIGGGIIAHGQLVTGAHNACAEIGHTKVVVGPTARPCNCGLRGCVEAYAGGTYLLHRVRSELGAGQSSLAAELAGDSAAVTPAHVDEAARRGDPYAVHLWEEVAPLLGAALANFCTLLNPEVLVLGGGVIEHAPELHRRTIESCWALINPPAGEGLRIVGAALGDDAGIIGASLLVAG